MKASKYRRDEGSLVTVELELLNPPSFNPSWKNLQYILLLPLTEQ